MSVPGYAQRPTSYGRRRTNSRYGSSGACACAATPYQRRYTTHAQDPPCLAVRADKQCLNVYREFAGGSGMWNVEWRKATTTTMMMVHGRNMQYCTSYMRTLHRRNPELRSSTQRTYGPIERRKRTTRGQFCNIPLFFSPKRDLGRTQRPRERTGLG
ncbi:hypothetical protein PYCCODRAFT_1439582 [Trametes coccinea BRFM310]|uniref:Uncharacterized protein n=1 Tax=Trametes coccinea (strain BRFM310) TaxID=1353009 RepID=A0A1Y2IAD9_TRAC3|nr:hypothetical protein PYCCODRAFT_1439582 [Trametes coccinea BRFM310]